jgi:endonuclease/exonuclease/phosphatase family metal-dependent hydrolase
MRVATYNLRHGAPAGSRPNLPAMQSAVASLGADVIAAQEVDRRFVRSWWSDQPARLARATGLVAHFAPARSWGPFGSYGNLLLVRGGARRHRAVPLPSMGEQRVALFAEVAVAGIGATVVCTHLQNRRDGRPDEAPDQLVHLLEQLRVWPEPWIVAGDLNLRPDRAVPLLQAAGLHPVVAGPTFPAEAPRLQLDWLAVKGMTVHHVEVPELRTSDHRPIVADLRPLTRSEQAAPGDAPPEQHREA